MGTVRYSCAVEGYADSWIEFDTRWTRADEAAIAVALTDAAYLELVRRKATAVHLVDAGTVYGDVAGLTEEGLAQIDVLLYRFIFHATATCFRELRNISDFVTRVSPPMSVKAS